MDTLPTPTPTPKLPIAPLTTALGDIIRWRILAELSRGEPLMVKELAARIGVTPGNISKHLVPLRKAGAVLTGRAHLQQIPKQFLPAPNLIDFGHCLLRMNLPE